MKNRIGNFITLTLFGESHGEEIGAVLDGVPAGIPVDTTAVATKLSLRQPQEGLSTARVEPDDFRIVSGVYRNQTTGTPICVLIPNRAQNSADYESVSTIARPGHADYTGFIKYHGFSDPRGGGHFSGRLTAPIVAAGAILLPLLECRGITVGTHLLRCAGIDDAPLPDSAEALKKLNEMPFAVVDEACGRRMKAAIKAAKDTGDSVGGILETLVLGLPAGLGEPFFDSVESRISHALFSIPAVKGVAFGEGFGFADLSGSVANDAFCIENGNVITKTNRNGGINGGITNGMPLRFTSVIKPTPSIAKPQETVDFTKKKPTLLEIHGRHDPCILPRARAVVDALTVLTLCDLLCEHLGTEALGETN